MGDSLSVPPFSLAMAPEALGCSTRQEIIAEKKGDSLKSIRLIHRSVGRELKDKGGEVEIKGEVKC